MVRLSESCGKNFEVIAKRLAYCDEWDGEEDFAGTSPASATTSNARWAALPATSTTKPSDATCSCTTTRWAQTTTCSAFSDPQTPLPTYRVALRDGSYNYEYDMILPYPRNMMR